MKHALHNVCHPWYRGVAPQPSVKHLSGWGVIQLHIFTFIGVVAHTWYVSITTFMSDLPFLLKLRTKPKQQSFHKVTDEFLLFWTTTDYYMYEIKHKVVFASKESEVVETPYCIFDCSEAFSMRRPWILTSGYFCAQTVGLDSKITSQSISTPKPNADHFSSLQVEFMLLVYSKIKHIFTTNTVTLKSDCIWPKKSIPEQNLFGSIIICLL